MIDLNFSDYSYLLDSLPYLAGVFAFGYALGSIPYGLLLTKSAGLGDIRKTGSGNIGATNVLRTGNKKLAALTLLLDMSKAAAAVAVVAVITGPVINENMRVLPNPAAYIAGLGALLGHMFPIWLKGKGGKGVACYFGILLSLNWQVFLITASNWILIFLARRVSSLAALFAALFVPFWLLVFTDKLGMVAGIIYSVLVILKHGENIRRLMNGEEKPFGSSKNASDSDTAMDTLEHTPPIAAKEQPSA